MDSLTDLEKDMLLRWFMHWLPLEKRREIMAQFPQAYNKLCGRKIVKVVQCSETVGPGTSCIIAGKTYAEGDVLPEREIVLPGPKKL